MVIFYHGSSVLFTKFDLAHVLDGDGKVKFGYGVYLTSSFKSAAHYSETKSRPADTHYVYTVEVPDLTDDNHIDFKKPVNPDIVKRAENKLGFSIPEKKTFDGKDFRKFLAKHFEKQIDMAPFGECNKSAYQLEGEKLASEFLTSIGVDFITWPYNWKNPDLGLNIAVLDDSKVKIIKIHQVELDTKKQLVPDSEREVSL